MYAVEFSHRSGRDLLNVAKSRTNIVPIIEDARHPHKYRMLVGRLCSGRLCSKFSMNRNRSTIGRSFAIGSIHFEISNGLTDIVVLQE